MNPIPLQRKDAMKLLRDGRPHRLRLWKMSTGAILTYPDAVFFSRHIRGGLLRLRLAASGQMRSAKEFCIFEIDGRPIYW